MDTGVADKLFFLKVFKCFKIVFLVLLTRKRPNMSALKEVLLNEIKH